MHSTEPAPVQLRLVVRAPEGSVREIEVDAYTDAPVGTVARAIAEEAGLEGDGTLRLHCARTGTALEGERSLGSIGLSHGDELVATAGGAATRRSAPPAELELAIVGGVDAGRRIPLKPGRHVLGRGSGADAQIEDPVLSSEHLALLVDASGRVEAVDLGSSNGTQVEGVSLERDEPRMLELGAVVQAGRTLFRVDRSERHPRVLPVEADGSVPFNRPPRVHRPVEPATRPFPAPPNDPYRSRLPLAASLVPLVMGVGLYLLTGFPTMLLFAALSPVMALTSFLEDRRSGRRGFARESRSYREKLVGLKDELERARSRELAQRRAAAPAAPELVRRAVDRESALWERRADDSDFMSLRVGTAEQTAHLSVRIDPGGSDELRQRAEEIAQFYASVAATPVVLPLAELGVVGLCGPPERTGSLARWLVVQAAVLHSPRDVLIGAALAEDRLSDWSWLKWLPHARSGTAPPAARLTTGPAGARDLLESLAELVRERRREAESSYGSQARRPLPALLVLVDETVAPERPLVAEALADAAECGVGVIWLGRERRDLPGECRAIVELDGGVHRLAYTDTRSGTELPDVTAEGLDPELAREAALALAPVRDTGVAGSGAVVPERIALVDLIGADELDGEWIAERWAGSPESRVALLGAGAGGPFSVDLRRDGPHALVAGITGAGKSELLQTLIVSIASHYSPARLTFLLIDYKGGAAFKECVRLPHTVGYVTDLDGHLAQRALISLNAELRRRERLLRDVGAKDLVEMEQRDPDTAPPSLAIVIDEFATLAREVPEFVDGVVDVAQRGRSLGVHLVLATQRPAGVVSENIRANTNLRIALRVNESAESTDVIGAPDAARIARDRPGRAFARTGHGELTEFQTAYVGGAATSRRQERTIVVRSLSFESGPVAGVVSSHDDLRETDLQRLVEAAEKAAGAAGMPPPIRPWLPPLEPVVPLVQLAAPEPVNGDATSVAAVGLLDEPSLQRQQTLVLELESEGSVLVYGAGGSGKTGLLRTLAVSLARSAAPDELHLYGLDFATRGLLALEELPHCGAVIAGEDEERVARLYSLLRRTMERRKLVFSQHGVFSLSEFRRAGLGETLPRILVLLDGYAGFAAAFERVNLGELVEALPRLVADGRPLGVHFAITADRRGAVPNTLAGIVPAKLILRMADDDELAAFGIPVKAVRGAQLPPGRGFLQNASEFQIALVGNDPSGEGQARALAQVAGELRERWPDAFVPPIEPLPTRVERRSLPVPDRRLAATVGLGDAELDPVTIELAERHFLVTGSYRSGRSTALETIVASLRDSTPRLELHLLAPRRTPLLDAAEWASVARGVQDCDAAAVRLAELQPGAARVVVIDDSEELAESSGAPALEGLVRRGRDGGVCVLAACERQAAARAFAGWIRELRKDEHGLLLDPDPDVDGDILGVRLPRRSNPVFPPGRGYLVDRGLAELVQVAEP